MFYEQQRAEKTREAKKNKKKNKIQKTHTHTYNNTTNTKIPSIEKTVFWGYFGSDFTAFERETTMRFEKVRYDSGLIEYFIDGVSVSYKEFFSKVDYGDYKRNLSGRRGSKNVFVFLKG